MECRNWALTKDDRGQKQLCQDGRSGRTDLLAMGQTVDFNGGSTINKLGSPGDSLQNIIMTSSNPIC
uniref:Uncharacterized protein n=1 Tax=Romanomermis culicivorax TaxID=13658 RepID=A0A915HUY7_ROMCU